MNVSSLIIYFGMKPKLADSYDIFLKKGLFLSTPRALFVLKHMTPSIENILHLEQKLSGPVAI